MERVWALGGSPKNALQHEHRHFRKIHFGSLEDGVNNRLGVYSDTDYKLASNIHQNLFSSSLKCKN